MLIAAVSASRAEMYASSPIPHVWTESGSSQSERYCFRLNDLTFPLLSTKSFVLSSNNSSRFPQFLEIPSASLAVLPAKDLISEPSPTISAIQRKIFASTSAVCMLFAALVTLAWSVQQMALPAPRCFLWALFNCS